MIHEVNLDNSKSKEVLTVNYGDKQFNIPLAKSLSVKEATMLNTNEKALALMLKYIPDDIQDEMTVDSLAQIMTAWNKASKDSGDNPGES